MLELMPRYYHRVIPLIEQSGLRGHLALVYEVLEGRTNGQVFADAIDQPKTVLICPASGFFFAFGEADIECIRPVVEQFWQHPEEMAGNYTTLFGSNASWDQPLDRLFARLGSMRITRLAFEQRSEPPDLPIPPGLRLEPIDARWGQAILNGSGTGGFGIDPWFIRVAGGPETYARFKLGLALVSGDQITSIAGFCGLGHGEAELEVGTVPAHLGRGLATVVSAAFMRQCCEQGIQPAYSCDARNLSSIAVAHKLGFVEMEEIHGYEMYKRVESDKRP